MTAQLRTVIQAIGFAFNGQGGARLSTHLGIQVSRPTILKSLYLVPVPVTGQVSEGGIDDFAWKRGKRYGTIIIDLRTHKMLDLLPDREAENVCRWLISHPEIEIVSRDRGGTYAEGAAEASTSGDPGRSQVAPGQERRVCSRSLSGEKTAQASACANGRRPSADGSDRGQRH
jgi:hypothetical protein